MQITPDRKTVYFIRHGQSEGNILKHFQDANDPLSTLGRKQAQRVAERAKKLKGEVILTSPMSRALETAKAIQKATGLTLEENSNLREFLVPTSLQNKPIHSPEGDSFHAELFKNLNNPEWRYEDEENYLELHTRAVSVLDHLENRKENTVLVVTHGAFMSSILTVMLLEGQMNRFVATNLFRFLRKKNTGITRCEYFKNNGEKMNWRLTTWNDHAHLVGIETSK
jgi:broad specificity phosphatase PhoE